MLRKYSFMVRFNDISTITEDIDGGGKIKTYHTKTRLVKFYANNDLDAFSKLCKLRWYQNINYDRNITVIMTSVQI